MASGKNTRDSRAAASKPYLILVTLIFFLSSCGSDDNRVTVEINDYSEQLAIDDALLVDYLSTHFYNNQDFPRSENEIVSIEIDTISGDNADKIPLIDQVQQISVQDLIADRYSVHQ